MKNILLIDFGSTYTKVTAVDAEAEKILGTASAYTTVQTDINDGLNAALSELEAQTGKVEYAARYACSSAAGGLRMIVSGLVPELTSEAARLASLGAGAKIIGQFSFELTEEDLEEIQAAKPDIFLLVGGTDGGNTDCILHNAKMLASIHPAFPIVIAGNRTAARPCQKLLEGCETYVCDNVMPKFGKLCIEPTQKQIREIFLKKIIYAKGLSSATALLSGILMPTPAALLQAMELLSGGTDGEPGLGELVAVDVGGATTDVYSLADGMPQEMNTVYKGLPEPFAKRTVEGDIGMRYSVHGIEAAAGIDRLARLAGLSTGRTAELIEYVASHTDVTPNGDDELSRLDYALASCAVETAVTRHAGTMEEAYTMMGLTYVQSGKNLNQVTKIIVTGGSLIHTERTEEIARHALADPMQPQSLRPKRAEVFVDRRYILAAMGLLSAYEPRAALHIMKKELEKHGYSE